MNDEFLINKRIKELRKRKGLSQVELAKILGIDPNTWSRYERGETKPSYKVLGKIVDFFRCDAYWLLTGRKTDRAYILTDLEKTIIDSFRSLGPDEEREIIEWYLQCFKMITTKTYKIKDGKKYWEN